MSHYNREPILPVVAAAAMGALFISGMISLGRALEHTPDKIRDVQQRNEQLRDQLDDARHVGDLVLDPENMTFKFQTEDPTGQAETCTGTYAIENDVAVASEQLDCTHPVPAGN